MTRLLALIFVLIVTFANAAAAPAPRWTPSSMMQVRRIAGVYPSPDGKRVAYTVREAVMEDNRSEYVTQIFLADADGGNPVQFTRSSSSSDHPQWSPDGKQIAFISTRSGKANLWLIPVSGGEAEQLTDVKTAISSFAWAPRGQIIAFTMLDPPTAEEEAAAHTKADAHLVDDKIKQSRLYLLPVQKDPSGKRPYKAVTPDDYSVTSDFTGYDWSPSGRLIAFAHTRSPKVDDWPTSDLSLLDVTTGKIKTLAATAAAETMPKFSPDGSAIAFVRSDNPVTWGGDGTIHLIDPRTGAVQSLAATPDRKPVIFGWSSDGQTIYCGEVKGTRSQIYALPLRGEAKPLSNWEGAASAGVHLSRDGNTAGFAWEWPDKAPEAYISKTENFEPVVISRVNRHLPKLALGDTQTIRWKSSDGREIEGLLTYPVNYKQGERVPLLLVIHGGPAGVFLQSFIASPSPYPVAAFASRGYAVLRANPRGSSGYGKDFRYANYKDWGGKDYQDLMTGVDHVINMGVADPDKLGVMGWSYGGFMTSWVITQTKRFKAASVGAGVTNLASFTGTADIPSFLPDYFGGEFWNADQIYRDHSPVYKTKGVSTPTLIQHGAADERVPLSQGKEFYNALKRQNCPVKMVVYPRTPHGISEPRLLQDAMTRNLQWFDEHLRGVPAMASNVQPPKTRKENIKDVLHGVEVVDPYRWLEDQTSPDTRAWLEEQHNYARAILDPLPARAALKKRIGELLKTNSLSTPSIRNERYFYSRRKADQDMPVFYVREGKDGPERVLLDCNTLTPDKSMSANTLDISDDGSTWVFGMRHGGEDEVTVLMMDVDTKRLLPDKLPRARYSGVALSHDKDGLYYSRMNKDGPRVYYLPLGQPGAAEEEIFGKGYGPDKIIPIQMSDDGKYLLITVLYGSAASKTELYVLNTKSQKIVTITKDVPARFNGEIGGDTLFVRTNWKAPNNRLLAIDLNNPVQGNWKEIVPEAASVMQGFSLINRKLFVSYLENVASRQRIFAPDGKPLGEVKFPGLGTGGVTGRWDQKEAFLNFQNFVTPSTTYHYDPDKGIGEIWFKPNLPIKSDGFEVKQVRYKSKDGVEIPMFLVHKKDLMLDGSNPVFLTGYGGFNLSRTPAFAASIALWCERGGVYALPSLRGGGEFGEAWHKAGMLDKKQNVFDDFTAAAEWLIANKYTNPKKLAIQGGSNGGLLVGAALTQRPDLFHAVVCAVPLLDMVRYHQFLVARFWVPEYGSAENAEQFKYILAYSPYHHVKPGTNYPAVMFITGDSDTRVAPLHARKMCALLQSATGSGPEKPIILHYDTKAGHSRGQPISKQIDDLTDEFAFLFWQLGMTMK